MFSTSDTIVAIATPPGRGGIGVIRLSGPEATTIARALIVRDKPLEPRRATLTTVRLKPNAVSMDHVVATYFPAPASYTGDDVVELSAHGSPVVLRTIVEASTRCGARLAEPGEFTLRAFLNGRMDLLQAEAVADLIEAVTPLQARAAFDQLQGTLTQVIGEIDAALFDLIARLEASIDFPEEGYHFVDPGELAGAIDGLIDRTTRLLADSRRGRLLREGLQIAIVGRPNVGKSSLFNALVGTSRAIVTPLPGTTRDLVTEVIDLNGLRVTLVDTAGLHQTRDTIEWEGVQRARQAQAVSDLIVIVLDGAAPLDDADREILRDTAQLRRIVVINKSDLDQAWTDPSLLRFSAKTLAGMDDLRETLTAALDFEAPRDQPEITNVRHIDLVERAQEALTRARTAVSSENALPEEFVLADLQDARVALEQIVGKRTTDDVLAYIFTRFCVGK